MLLITSDESEIYHVKGLHEKMDNTKSVMIMLENE